MSLSDRLNTSVTGPIDRSAVVLVHGFGCGLQIWRRVAPQLAEDHRVVVFDLPGTGSADPSAYDPVRHASLEGYRDDVIALLEELDLGPALLVGHSVSAMIVALVQIARPDLVDRLVLLSPSARYIDDADYVGGFSADDIEELLDLMSRNHLGWQDPLSTMVAGSASSSDQQELAELFCRMRPEIAAQFAGVTFRGDNRADLARVSAPTLVVQVREDVVAPMSAGSYVSDHIAGSRYRVLETVGHCPQLSAPEETVAAIRGFLGAPSALVAESRARR